MIGVIASVLLGCMTDLPVVPTTKAVESPTTHPIFVDAPKSENGLTLYNEKGEVVARCRKKNGSLSDCKMEAGVTLDDLMNAWAHAYLDVQK